MARDVGSDRLERLDHALASDDALLSPDDALLSHGGRGWKQARQAAVTRRPRRLLRVEVAAAADGAAGARLLPGGWSLDHALPRCGAARPIEAGAGEERPHFRVGSRRIARPLLEGVTPVKVDLKAIYLRPSRVVYAQHTVSFVAIRALDHQTLTWLF